MPGFISTLVGIYIQYIYTWNIIIIVLLPCMGVMASSEILFLSVI